MDWKSLAIQLELSGTKIEEIDVNNRGQVSHCRRDMIQFWLQSDISCSWQKLIGALMSTKQSVLADEIRVTYCPMYQGQLIKMHVQVFAIPYICNTSVHCIRAHDLYACCLELRYIILICSKHSGFGYDSAWKFFIYWWFNVICSK